MKMGIIGVGAVGSAVAMAAASRAHIREIVLVDLNRARAKAVATDMHYGQALSPVVTIRDGDYADLADAGVVIVTAGVNEKAGGATDRSDHRAEAGEGRSRRGDRGRHRSTRAAGRGGAPAGRP
jgi:L-lactate dehydrogenase